jgi:hypothetical protein
VIDEEDTSSKPPFPRARGMLKPLLPRLVSATHLLPTATIYRAILAAPRSTCPAEASTDWGMTWITVDDSAFER